MFEREEEEMKSRSCALNFTSGCGASTLSGPAQDNMTAAPLSSPHGARGVEVVVREVEEGEIQPSAPVIIQFFCFLVVDSSITSPPVGAAGLCALRRALSELS